MSYPIRDFEEMKIGETVKFSRQIKEKDVEIFSELTGDLNPVHLDKNYAEQTIFRGRIVHGMLTSSFISRIIGMSLPGNGAVYLSQNLKFLRPVKVDDTITVVAEVVKKNKEKNTLLLKTEIFNSQEEKVVTGQAEVMILKQKKTLNAEKISKGRGEKTGLKGRVVLITGSSRGIGRASAQCLAGRGASVAVNYLKSEGMAKELVNTIKKEGGKAIAFQADVSQKEQVEKMMKEITSAFGPVDTLINNAMEPPESVPFSKLKWESYEKSIHTVVKGAFNCIQTVLEGMKQKKFGKIINVISSYAIGTPPAGLSPYVTAKAGLIGLSRSLAAELGPLGITVNMISPGMVETDMTAQIPERFKQDFAIRTPLRRIANAEDVAQVIGFLVSEESDYLTGCNIPVCGGQLMI